MILFKKLFQGVFGHGHLSYIQGESVFKFICISRINRTYILKHAQILSEPLVSISATEPFLISCSIRLERRSKW